MIHGCELQGVVFGGSHIAYCLSRNVSSLSSFSALGQKLTEIPFGDFHSSSAGAGKPPSLQVRRKGKGQGSEVQGSSRLGLIGMRKPRGSSALFFFKSSRISLGTKVRKRGSWDRQREGQILGPGSPEGRQPMQTAGNVARRQNDPSTVPDFALSLPLSHLQFSPLFSVRLLYFTLLFPLLYCLFLFPFPISVSSPPFSCSDMTQYLLRLNQCLHASSDSSLSQTFPPQRRSVSAAECNVIVSNSSHPSGCL